MQKESPFVPTAVSRQTPSAQVGSSATLPSFPDALRTAVKEIRQLYAKMDDSVLEFCGAMGLRCPDGCGSCCLSPAVQASILEMLPLAVALTMQGQAEFWLACLDEADGQERCVCFQADNVVAGNGRCRVYPWRPTICRLFPFATVRDKHGDRRLTTCAVLRESIPPTVAEASARVARGEPAPTFCECAGWVGAVDPNGDSLPMPINDALRAALQRVALASQLATTATDPDLTLVPPPEEPRFPDKAA